jgi:hypothetical protein
MLNLKKKQYSKINKYRRTFHNTRHRKKGKYIGGKHEIDRYEFEDLKSKSITLNNEAEKKLKLIIIEHNEASKALKEALYNVGIQEEDNESAREPKEDDGSAREPKEDDGSAREPKEDDGSARETEEDNESARETKEDNESARETEEDNESARETKVAAHKEMKEAQDNVDIAEMDFKRETDQFNQGISVKGRMIASKKILDDANIKLHNVNKKLGDPMKKLYEAEDNFEEADDKLTKANAEVEACKLYEKKNANTYNPKNDDIKMDSFQSKETLVYNGRLASHAYHMIFDDFPKVKTDYLAKKKLYEDKIKEIINKANPNQTMSNVINRLFYSSNKIKQKKALNTYYKNNPESKKTVDELKSDKKRSEMIYHVYNFLIPHLKTDYDNAVILMDKKQKREDDVEVMKITGISEEEWIGRSDGRTWSGGGRKKRYTKKRYTKKRYIKRRPKKNKY